MELALGCFAIVVILLMLLSKRFHEKSAEPLLHKLHNHNETIRVMTEEIKSLKSSLISLKLSLMPKLPPPPPPKEPEDPEIVGALIDSNGKMREYEIIPTMPEAPQLEVKKRKVSRAKKKKSTRRK